MQEVRLNEFGNVLRPHPRIPNAFRVNHQVGAALAKAQ